MTRINVLMISMLTFVLMILGWYYTEGYGFINTDITGSTPEEAICQYTLYSMPNGFLRSECNNESL